MTNIQNIEKWRAELAAESEHLLAEFDFPRDQDSSATEAARVLPAEYLARAAWAFTTRRVNQEHAQTLIWDNRQPNAGDLVLARIDSLGHHANLQLIDGRRCRATITKSGQRQLSCPVQLR